jgi:flavin reductase (DIM6/NTAB) family NADH-FMN oxidoreductase RutF
MKKSLGAKTLGLPCPVWVIGSYDAQGKPNIMTASWVGICCSVPPCAAVSLRKATYTYGSIMARKAFTISIPSEKHLKETDFIGMSAYSGRSVDKFAKTKLTAVKSTLVDAPYVQEFPLVLECKVVHTFELGLHTQFVGEIMDVKADAEMLNADGEPDIEKIMPVVFTPQVHAYHAIGRYLGPGFSIGQGIAEA